MTRYVALDPGGTTGWCSYDSDTNQWNYGEFEGEHHKTLWTFIYDFNPNVIICERFEYRSGKDKADLRAREYIGVAKLYYQQIPNIELVMQIVSFGKDKTAFWNNEKLKQINLYYASSEHARDATRHMLHYLGETEKHKWVKEMLRTGNQ